MTYARGEELNEGQRAQLALEKSDEIKPDADSLLGNWSDVVETALDQLKGTSESELTHVRLVGRSRLESTVLGLLFHAAEHASRHTGQIVTTAIMVRSSSLAE